MTRYSPLQSKASALATAIALTQLVIWQPMPVFAAAVNVAGQSVFNIQNSAGGISAGKRTEIVQHNLDNALVAASNRGPSSVRVVYVKGAPVITLGGYQIVTVDSSAARMAGTKPAVLAGQWADSLKEALSDQASVDDYVAQLTGGTGNGSYTPTRAATTPVQRAHIVYVPAGMVIPVKLTAGIDSELAQAGDRIEAQVSNTINLSNGSIPEGSIVLGQVVDSTAGRRLGRSGELTIKFTRLRTPDGAETPITAHIMGSISKYSQIGGEGSDTIKGETTKNKVESAAIRTGVGAGAGALLGTAIGAIAGHGHGVGRGAWSGAAIGGGLGLADALLLRKGADIKIKSGEQLQLQLDAPAQVASYGSGNL